MFTGNFWNIVPPLIFAALCLCPPKYDPAIRLKEWLESKRKK